MPYTNRAEWQLTHARSEINLLLHRKGGNFSTSIDGELQEPALESLSGYSKALAKAKKPFFSRRLKDFS